MTSRSYSFLDVAVLDPVRGRLGAGDALIILATSLAQVLWANGPGAQLLGYSDIFSLIGADPRLPATAQRQIQATQGFPRIGSDRPVALRLANGMASRVQSFVASHLVMPDGEAALLLAAPVEASATRDEIVSRAISGLSGDGQFVALIDGKGALLAASEGFGALGIVGETLRELADQVVGEGDRLVKRLIPSGRDSLPAGIARLSDEPPLNLLMIVDEALPAPTQGVSAPATHGSVEVAMTEEMSAQPAMDEAGDGLDETIVEEDGGKAEDAGGTGNLITSAAPPAPRRPRRDADGDRWYFNGETPPPNGVASASAATDRARREDGHAPSIRAEMDAQPLRFVWRTDAAGRFSAISDEFRAAFGDEAADIVGRSFNEVAARFGLDPENEIAGLLARRDTWSGRAVLWPIAGTDLKVPVDLAALPVYDRDRVFQGFRGFGVARMGDAVIDPDAIGLSLSAPEEDEANPVPAELSPQGEAAAANRPLSPIGRIVAANLAGHEPPAQSPVRPTDDEFRGEPPVLKIEADVPKPASDKVIRLEERRSSAARGLSASERLNFREIGEKLRNSGLVAPEPLSDAKLPSTAAPEAHADSASDGGTEGARSEAGASPAAPLAEDVSQVVGQPDRPADIFGQTAEGTAQAGESVLREAISAPTSAPAEAGGQEAVTTRPSMSDATADELAPLSESREGAPDPEAGPRHFSSPAKAEGAGERGEAFMPSAFAGMSTQAGADGIDAAVLSRLPLPLLVHAGDALFYANREFLEITGYDSLADLERAGGLGAIFGEPYESEDASDRKLRLKAREGGECPVDAFLQSIAWNGGKALLLALRRAVEEQATVSPAEGRQTAAEENVEARLEELRTIIDTATDGVVIIGNDGRIRSISRPAEALFGVDGFNLVGQPFSTLFAMESQKAANDYLAGLAENGVASVLNDGREVIGREAKGRFIPLFMTIGRLPHEGGFCAVLRDITQWKRAEEDLTEARAAAERASRQKTEFLARVSHEIRTPLNAIIGFSELMLDEKFGPITNERYRDYLRDINKSGNHVLDLVNDLLDISKIEAGEQEMNYEAVSLNETLGEAVAMMQPQANRERVIIRSSFASRLPEVVADLRSIRQIALNLLSNAIRYTPAGGQVIISTVYEPSGDIVVRVRDTGIGMAVAEIEQALKPFKQINALKRPRGDGTGLGLPLTKAMVEANRARFAIHSTPGEGTLVEVTFPSTRVLAH